MREILSQSLVELAMNDDSFLLLSGDHGYALFDPLRTHAPEKFVNVGIMEQSMVGMAAGLVAVGYRPIVYGLSAFVPMRVLEQIKLDICFSKSPVKLIGDGAGVVYSYLGNSHFCTEDVGALMTMPHLEIYTPGDSNEMAVCLKHFYSSNNPGYLRVGKSDNPETGVKPKSISPYFTNNSDSSICIVSMGSMNGISAELAREFNISHLSVMQVKPIDQDIVNMVKGFDRLIFIEEHHKYGGLKSIVFDAFSEQQIQIPSSEHYCFGDKFIEKCGSYQYALSEHGLSFVDLKNRLTKSLC